MKPYAITAIGVLLVSILELSSGTTVLDGRDYDITPKAKPITAQLVEKETIKKLPTTCQDYRSIIAKYDWDVSIASAVMMAESSCNPDAVGDTWPINGLLAPSCGLMQVRTLVGRPSCEELKDPQTNIEWSYKLYKANGFQPWSMYNNGQYKKFL